MRPLARLLVLAGVALVLAAPMALASPGGRNAPSLDGSAPAAVDAPLSAVAQNALAARAWNATPSVSLPDSSGLPTSAYFTTPPPAVPDTTPVVMYFSNNSVATASTNCCVFANFTAPTGTWAMIVLNYTGRAEIDVFDSSYRAYIDQSMVLFGTTPEYGTWTVLKDITEYSTLFRGTFNLSFFMSAAIPSGTGGYFLNNFSIAFYPVPTGGHAPREPDTIDPLWFRVSVSPSNPSIYVATDVPLDATNATMELFAYGFGLDEFWYSSQPGYRSIEVEENGTPIASVLPFQYINTGGIDFLTWRPITGTFTLSDRPYELNVTAGLGLLEGPRNLTARLNGVTTSSDWIIAGSLLLFTDSNAFPAQTTGYAWNSPPPQVHSTSTAYDETASVTYAYSSLVGTSSGLVNVSLNRSVTYTSALTTGGSWLGATWNNLTATEAADTVVTSAYPSGPVTANATAVFSASMNIGDAFVESSSNGGTYPIYGNFTDYFDNVHQQWSEELSVTGPSSADAYFEAVVGQDTAGTNIWSGAEELISASAALVLKITSIQSQTNQLFGQDVAAPAGGGVYNHLLEGAGLQPPGPYNAETILLNVVSSPLSVGVVLSRGTTDAGVAVTLTATISGGAGTATVAWAGLPPGCASQNVTQLTCRPSASGVYPVSALVSDGSGGVALSADAILVVNPALHVDASAALETGDVGIPIAINASVSGGTPSYACAWSIGTAPFGAPSSCATSLSLTGATIGSQGVTVEVTDALGITAMSSELEISFVSGPAVEITPPANTTPYVGHPVTLTALLDAVGAGITAINWTVNGTVTEALDSLSYTFLPLGGANYTLGVTVTDREGQTASQVITIQALPLPVRGGNGGGSTNGSGSNAGLPPAAYVALGLALGAAFGVGVTLLARPPSRRPPARPRPAPAPPAYAEDP